MAIQNWSDEITVVELGDDPQFTDEMGALMELARAGRIHPIPIETRSLDQAQETLYDLAEGNLVGRVVLKP